MSDLWEDIHRAVNNPDDYEVLWHCICNGPQVWSVREILKETEHQPGTASERLSGYIAVHWGTLTTAARPLSPISDPDVVAQRREKLKLVIAKRKDKIGQN